MVLEHGKDHASQWEAIGSIAPKIGCMTETLRGWFAKRNVTREYGLVLRVLIRSGSSLWSGRSGSFVRRMRSCASIGLFCDGGARPPVEAMIAFIDAHREVHGVEPICPVDLP